jgi:phosphoglucosamine mutase
MLKNVRFAAGTDPLGDADVKAAIAEGEAALAGTGRVLIRKSGTEPLIRVMAEAEDEALMGRVVEGIVSAVRAAG